MDCNREIFEKLIQHDGEEAVLQNLKDAGCGLDTIDCCIKCLNEGKKKELLKHLEEHRDCLLNKVHEEEKQIACLDYLIYQIRRC